MKCREGSSVLYGGSRREGLSALVRQAALVFPRPHSKLGRENNIEQRQPTSRRSDNRHNEVHVRKPLCSSSLSTDYHEIAIKIGLRTQAWKSP